MTTDENPEIKKLSINVSPDLLRELDAVVKRNGPFARRHSVHVAAFRLGLREITANPNRLVEALACVPGVRP